ncbi:MAG: hypothetical protein ACYDAC_01130 [Candidatus Dormibacteria bacterium]
MSGRGRATTAGRVLALLGASVALGGCSAGAPVGSIPGVVPSAVPSTLPSDVAEVTGGAATAAAAFLRDMEEGLCPAAFQLVTDPLKTEAATASGLCSLVPTGAAFTLGSTTTLTSTSAFVSVTLTVGGKQRQETLTLLAPASSWLVSEVNAGGAPSPGSGGATLGGIIDNVEQQYAQSDGGTSVTVTCPQAGNAPIAAGQQFTCNYSDAAGRSGTLTIFIDSDSGAFRWTIP